MVGEDFSDFDFPQKPIAESSVVKVVNPYAKVPVEHVIFFKESSEFLLENLDLVRDVLQEVTYDDSACSIFLQDPKSGKSIPLIIEGEELVEFPEPTSKVKLTFGSFNGSEIHFAEIVK